MSKIKTLFLFVLFTALFGYAISGFAVQIPAPVVTVYKLFVDLVMEDEFEGWKIAGISNIQVWTQGEQGGLRKRRLAENKDHFILTYPLTNKPVLLNEANQEFFSDVPKEYPRDGTWMGFKYAFLPESVLLPTDADLGSPVYFFLLKRLKETNFKHPMLARSKATWRKRPIVSTACINRSNTEDRISLDGAGLS
jgi:hypothetical protein